MRVRAYIKKPYEFMLYVVQRFIPNKWKLTTLGYPYVLDVTTQEFLFNDKIVSTFDVSLGLTELNTKFF